MATPVEVPSLGESIKQAILVRWHKSDGERVAIDEPLCELETDKANTDVPCPVAGVLRRVAKEGDTVAVGEVIARVDAVGAAAAAPSPASGGNGGRAADATRPTGNTASGPGHGTSTGVGPSQATSGGRGAPPAAAAQLGDFSPAVRRLLEESGIDPKAVPTTGPGGRLTKEDVEAHLAGRGTSGNGAGAATDDRADNRAENARQTDPVVEETEEAPPRPAAKAGDMPPRQRQADIATKPAAAKAPGMDFDAHGERRTAMSKIRVRIAERLVNAQQTAAILTTFNEVDVQAIMDLRSRYKDRFTEVHGVGLGFMSFFARAAVLALREFPRVNAFLEGTDIIYHQYVHLGIAVSTDRGLVVPVLRNVEHMSFARIEAEIKRLALAARDGKLGIQEMSGGTFTITNGGIFGSLLSTPILNPPQSGILGMHNIVKRAVVVTEKGADAIAIRPMMYTALSYDHRLVDGRESVSFLVRLKQLLEDPARLMLEI